MRNDARVFLSDIHDCIKKIEEYMRGVKREKFLEEIQLQDAVMRRLEIIGEAAKNVSLEVRKKYPDIPWKKMAGLRDVLIHTYFGVNLERVWIVVKYDLPDLKKKIKKILEDLENEI